MGVSLPSLKATGCGCLRHAVMVRTLHQCKQFRKGLKGHTGILPLIQACADVVAQLFPDCPESYTAQMILDSIVFPQTVDVHNVDGEDEDFVNQTPSLAQPHLQNVQESKRLSVLRQQSRS